MAPAARHSQRRARHAALCATDVSPVGREGSFAPSALAPRQWHARERGVTLMELLLVLALLVIAGSIAIPAITGAFSSVRLRRAGDAVIARWAEARAQAIETGAPYQFRFTPETGKYRLEPWAPAAAEAAAVVGSSRVAESRTATASDEAKAETAATHKSLDQSPTIETVLPESILFQGGQSAAYDKLSGERRVDSLQSLGDTWSTPILFFPDGTTTSATVVLQNDLKQYLRLTLRGLTGVGRVSDVLTSEELQETSRTR
jgi:prepilin-type N-terminal cleavage/methylation domain-containing protein